MADAARTLYTIGHGSRALSEFIGILQRAGIEALVDVRAQPGSRRHPHFARAPLQTALAAAGIDYQWQGAAFGGFRKPAPDSPHIALTHAAFRGYADHPRSGSWTRRSVRLSSRLARRDEAAGPALQRGVTTPGGSTDAQSGA